MHLASVVCALLVAESLLDYDVGVPGQYVGLQSVVLHRVGPRFPLPPDGICGLGQGLGEHLLVDCVVLVDDFMQLLLLEFYLLCERKFLLVPTHLCSKVKA